MVGRWQRLLINVAKRRESGGVGIASTTSHLISECWELPPPCVDKPVADLEFMN
jgi:hypothetical protein